MESISEKISSLRSAGATWNPTKEVDIENGEKVEIRRLSGVRYTDSSGGSGGGVSSGSDTEDGDGNEENVNNGINAKITNLFMNPARYQSMDITFPNDFLASQGLSNDETESTTENNTEIAQKKFPVWVHVHGGGWSRGSNASFFYGAPSVCENMAASGYIAIAPGYRLGNYPRFMEDVAKAIQWVKLNIEELGGDLDNIYLSGHSAGAHISSLSMLRYEDFWKPFDIPIDFFRGLVLISGVFDLFCPLQKRAIDAKNKAFVVAYVLPAFGTDGILRRQASPLLLLNPRKDATLLGTAALKFRSSFRRLSSTSSESLRALVSSKEFRTNGSFDEGEQRNSDAEKQTKVDAEKQTADENDAKTENSQDGQSDNPEEEAKPGFVGSLLQKTTFMMTSSWSAKMNDGNNSKDIDNETKDESLSQASGTSDSNDASESLLAEDPLTPEEAATIRAAMAEIKLNTEKLPPTLILNAYLDMGLQENGKLMAEAMSKHTRVEYQLLPNTDHASICWQQNTFSAIREFVATI